LTRKNQTRCIPKGLVNTKQYLENLKTGVQMKFSDFLDLIEQEYTFLNIAFTNNGLSNSKDENQGSAKVFCFGLMHSLDEKDVIGVLVNTTNQYLSHQRM